MASSLTNSASSLTCYSLQPYPSKMMTLTPKHDESQRFLFTPASPLIQQINKSLQHCLIIYKS
jgi:hypothetical protein